MAEKIVIDITTKGAQQSASAFSKIGAAAVSLNQGLELAKKAATGLIAPFQSIVGEGSSFSQQMQNVAAVSKTTATEFKALSDEAKRIGATTSFSATEAAKGMEELRRAGLSTTQTLQTTQQAMNLSSATGMDLATAAQTTAINMKIFSKEGLTAESVANLLTQTAGAAATNADELKFALEATASTASAAGFSFKETTVVLGAMANAGVRGEKAGTALNGALARLMLPTSAVKDELEKLGLTTDDVNPKTQSFATILDNLKNSGAGVDSILTILGQEAGPKFMKLIEQGGDSLRDFEAAQNGANTALQASQIRMNSLEGDTKIFSSTVSGIKISIFEALEPILRKVVQAATGFGEKFSKSIEGGKKDFGTFLIALGTGLKKIDTAISGSASSFDGTITNIKTIFATVFNFIKSVLEDNKERIKSIVGTVIKLGEQFSALASVVTTILAPVLKPLATLFYSIMNAALKLISVLTDQVLGALKKVASELTDSAPFKFFQKWMGKATEAADAFEKKLDGNTVTVALQNTQTALSKTGDELIEIGKEFQKGTKKADTFEKEIHKADKTTDTLKDTVKATAKEVEKLGTKTGSFRSGFLGEAGTKSASEMAGGALSQVASNITGVGGALSGFQQGGPMGAAIGAITEIALANPKIKEALGKISEILGEVLAPVLEALLPIFEAVLPVLQALTPAIKTIAKIISVVAIPLADGIEYLATWIEKLTSYLDAGFRNFINNLKAVAAGLIRALFTLPLELTAKLVSKLGEVGTAWVTKLKELGSMWVTKLKELGSAWVTKLTEVGSSWFNKLKELGNIFKNKIKEAFGSIGKKASNMFGFEQGGYIPKAQGGMLVGNRHSGGGIPIEAEGGEFIMSRNAVERIGAENLRAMNSGSGGQGVNITMNIKAIDPRSQKEELRQVMEELFLSGRLRVA